MEYVLETVADHVPSCSLQDIETVTEHLQSILLMKESCMTKRCPKILAVLHTQGWSSAGHNTQEMSKEAYCAADKGVECRVSDNLCCRRGIGSGWMRQRRVRSRPNGEW